MSLHRHVDTTNLKPSPLPQPKVDTSKIDTFLFEPIAQKIWNTHLVQGD